MRKYERSQLYDQWKNIIQGSGPSSAPSPNLMPPGAPFNVPPPLMGRLPAVIPTHANLVAVSVHPSSSPSPPVVPQPVPQPETESKPGLGPDQESEIERHEQGEH